MRHLRGGTTSPISVRGARRSRRPTSTGMREVCRAASRRFRAREPAKGTLRFYADAARAPARSAAVRRRASTARAAYRRAARASCSTERALRSRRLRLPVAGRQPAGAAALPGGDLHAQRRVGDLAAARRNADATRSRRCLYGTQYRRMLRFEARALARFDGVLAVPTPTATRSRASIPAPRAAGARRPDRRRHGVLRAAPPSAAGARAPGLHRLDGLAAERRRDAVLLPRRSCRSIRAAEPDVDAHDRRPRADAGGPASWPRTRGVDVTGRVDDVRPYMRGRGGLRRAAADRRRHAAEDLRSDGDGQGRRLDDGRRRRAAGRPTASTSCSPTSRPRSRARSCT